MTSFVQPVPQPPLCSFSDFELGRYVHAGGYGTVYSATRKADGKRVALKFFGYTKNKPDNDEIEKEINLMMALDGVKGACQLLGVLTDTAQGYVPNKNRQFRQQYPILVMELLGVDLFVHLEERGDVSLDYLAQAFKSAMLGLQSIHMRKFLHRDLKIDNIVMASNDETNEMKIIDFGLMLAVDDPDKGVSTGRITGTLGYFAPETLRHFHYSTKSDIWQAGCILYTLLAGFPPFHAEEDANIHIMNGNYYPMEGPEWDIPTSEAKDLVRRMLTLDPEQRIDMTGVISHPWLTSPEISQVDKKAALQPMGQQYKSRIKGLVFRNKLKRFFLSNNIEAGLLSSSKDAAEFYFSQFDTDREGVINFDSMSRGIRHLIRLSDGDPEAISTGEMEALFRTIDTNDTGKVNFSNFLSFYEAILTGSTAMPTSIRSSMRLPSTSSNMIQITRAVSEMCRVQVDSALPVPASSSKETQCIIA